MMGDEVDPLSWAPQREADRAFQAFLEAALARCEDAQAFAARLLEESAVRIGDIVDHVALGPDDSAAMPVDGGWTRDSDGSWRHSQARLPAFVPIDGVTTVFIRVEDAEGFLDANRLDLPVEGVRHGPARRALAFAGPDIRFGVFERNGYGGFDIPSVDPEQLTKARIHGQAFKARRRQFDTPADGLDHTEQLIDAAVADIGPHWACHLWFAAERAYWMSKCAAGRIQKERQDAAGIGWSNIDHHTYDSSRRHYRHTIRILEKLGYRLREMIYAGELAGWGSQVLEQPVLGDTIFADVDLSPDEVDLDFSHVELPELGQHRRAGLVSALHGESILEAGLNHVAGLYDQRRLRRQFEGLGIPMMPPFSDFEHLYQELTEGDWGAVDPRRVDELEKGGHMAREQADRIRLEGAIVTHLENIERNYAFKGFNKPGIDGVLRKLDPRVYEPEVQPGPAVSA